MDNRRDVATSDPSSVRGIGAASGVVTFGALASVTLLLFDDLAVGLVVGALSGVGVALFVPYAVGLRDEEAASGGAPRGFHAGAAGAALSGSGVVALAILFVVENPALAVAVGLLSAAVEYVTLARTLPRPSD